MKSRDDCLARGCSTAAACVALSLLAACGPVTSASDATPTAPGDPAIALASSTIVPGVVIDPAGRRVYIMRPAGGIESLDVLTGRVRWTSSHADQPLFVVDDILLARAASTTPGLHIASLAVQDGMPVAAPQVLPLPAGVVAVIDETLAYTFRHSASESCGNIFLTWEYIERDVSGVAPSRRSGNRRNETGAFRYVDGELETATTAQPTQDNWPTELGELVATKRLRHEPWKTAELFVAAQQYHGPERLVLRRWRRTDGESLADEILFEGRALAVLAACDERHIAVSVPSGLAAGDPQYLLRYYALDTAKLILEVHSRRSVGPFCIVGARLLSLSQPGARREQGKLVRHPLELVAFDLETGDEVWRHELRDTAFRGAQPPRN